MDPLQEAFDEGFAAVKAYVDAEISTLASRLEALETRQPEKGEKGDPGEPGRDGRDGVDGAPGRDGVDGKDGAPGEKGEKGDPGTDGKDGVGLADAVIDREGNLVLTMTNGTTKRLGLVVGKDGAPGLNGKDGAPGSDGRDGKDGVGFDDLDLVVADDGVALVFERGEERKAFALPVVFDRGVFKEGASYRKGNGVTWGGQFWIAQKDAPEGKPDASPDWRLAVKKGRDARPAKVEVSP